MREAPPVLHYHPRNGWCFLFAWGGRGGWIMHVSTPCCFEGMYKFNVDVEQVMRWFHFTNSGPIAKWGQKFCQAAWCLDYVIHTYVYIYMCIIYCNNIVYIIFFVSIKHNVWLLCNICSILFLLCRVWLLCSSELLWNEITLLGHFREMYTLGSSNIAGWKMDPNWRCMDPIKHGDIPASYVSLPERASQFAQLIQTCEKSCLWITFFPNMVAWRIDRCMKFRYSAILVA